MLAAGLEGIGEDGSIEQVIAMGIGRDRRLPITNWFKGA